MLIALSTRVFSQSNNNISVWYGFSNTNVDIHGVIGDFGFNTKTGTAIGFIYTTKVNKLFSVQAGLLYADDKVEENSILPGLGGINNDSDIKMISIPVIARLTFFKYLFADGGVSIDKETNYAGNHNATDQSGIGLELGVGAQYTLSHITIFINPYYKMYGVAHFGSSSQNLNLSESGFKFGAGFNF
jgi:hypothetical protein